MKHTQSRSKAAPVDMMLHHTIFRKVPDEVMENILSYHMAVPFSLFCSPHQHFGKYDLSDLSSSVVLEVCRRWKRIGTPLLYETVVLRSQAQVLALRASLDANPTLWKHVKKLRVEHTSGTAIADVMQMCTTVTDLWVSLRCLGDREAGKGILKGLKYLDPRHVILWDCYSEPYKVRSALFSALPEVLRNWKKLVRHTTSTICCPLSLTRPI